MFKDLTGSRHSYVFVLSANKKRTISTTEEQMTMVEAQPHVSTCQTNHAGCQIQQQWSGRSRIGKCERINGLPRFPGITCTVTGKEVEKPQGFGHQNVGAILPHYDL